MRTVVIFSVAALLLVGGCTREFKLSKERMRQAPDWPYHHGDLAATGAVAPDGFSGRLDVVWESRAPDKPSGPVTLQYDALVYAGSRGKIRLFDKDDGSFLGAFGTSKRTNQTGLAVADSLAFYGTAPPRDKFICVNLLRGKVEWASAVKDAAPGPIIVENRVVVASMEGVLHAFDMGDGRETWRLETPARLVAPPTFANGTIYQPADQGQLILVDPATGDEKNRFEFDGSLVNAVAVEDLVYVALMDGRVQALVPETGAVQWEAQLPGRVWTSPSLSHSHVILGCSSGEVVALDRRTGQESWRYLTGESIRASATIAGEFVVVATLRGSVFSLDLTTGDVIERRKVRGGIDKSPVSDGKHVYVATRAGMLTCLGVKNVASKQEDHRSRAENKP